MSKFVYVVSEYYEGSGTYTTLAHCATLEAAKDYIRGRTIPEFKQASGATRVVVEIRERSFQITQQEVIG